jgi:hypothetical protein
MRRTFVDGKNDEARGFFRPVYYFIPLQHPLTYVSRPKTLVTSYGHHVFNATNVHVRRMQGDTLEGDAHALKVGVENTSFRGLSICVYTHVIQTRLTEPMCSVSGVLKIKHINLQASDIIALCFQ